MNESNYEADALIGQLRQLQPARSKLDPRQTFYQAGYEACRVQTQSQSTRHLTVGIAATLIAVMISSATSYHVGKAARSVPGFQDVAKAGDLRKDQTQEPLTPALGSPASVGQTLAAEASSEQARGVELAAQEPTKQPFASWINPLPGIAKSKKLDRQSESMLTTSHSSMFTLESSIRNLSEFPLSVNPLSQLAAAADNQPADFDDRGSTKTMAAGDFHAFAHGLEAIR